jgi:NAD(P)-dependent dehydrogenase (short-subunit alcohol dehydrogenase family)
VITIFSSVPAFWPLEKANAVTITKTSKMSRIFFIQSSLVKYGILDIFYHDTPSLSSGLTYLPKSEICGRLTSNLQHRKRKKETAMNKLDGKIALVTGASRGLGKGIALVLAEQGCEVVVNYRSRKAEAEKVAEAVRAQGRKALVAGADVSVEEEVAGLFETIRKEFGRLDILVNNAGTSQPKDIFQISLPEWEQIINTNLRSCFLCSKQAMTMMKEQGSGRIVNISSITGLQGALYGHVHYSATKAGMLGFTKTLARTAAPLGITVNAVAPGITETELLHQTLDPNELAKLAATTPLGLGQPRDIGLAVAFLCGEGGRYITGATLDVNGGIYMR